MRGVGDAFTVAGFASARVLLSRLPRPLVAAGSDAAADAVWRADLPDAQAMRANYSCARPELDAADLDDLVRAGLRAYLRYYCEVFGLPGLSRADVLHRVRLEGDAPVRAHFAQGRAVVAFLGHLGNWDLAGAWSCLDLAPVTTVAERLEPEEVFASFLDVRRRLGMDVVPLTTGVDVFGALRAATREARLVPLLADRDLTGGGVDVRFCARPARMAPGPAALAVTTGAPLHPITVRHEPAGPRRRDGHRIVVTMHPQVHDQRTGSTRARVLQMTQECADVLSRVVQEHTADWHMMQRVFVGAPPRLSRAASYAARTPASATTSTDASDAACALGED